MRMKLKRSGFGLATAIALSLAALTALIGTRQAAEAADAACTDRIISIGGDVTEILYALGVGKCIIAIDSTSQFPTEALKEKKNVGYMRALSAEGVLSAGGTLVLASESAGPAETIRALKSSSVRFVSIPDQSTPDGIRAKIELISKETGTQLVGTRLIAELQLAFANLEHRRQSLPQQMNTLFVLATNGSRIIVGGSKTSADSILSLSGAMNAAKDTTGFKPITIEALVAMAPDAIIVMQRGATGPHSAGGLLEFGAIKQTPAGRAGRIYEMSGSYLLGFGPRTPAAATDLMAKLYANRK